jgi:hypothetical protein
MSLPAAHAPRLRDPRPTCAPVPADQRLCRQLKADDLNERKSAHIKAWLADMNARAQRMAEEFDITHCRALDLLHSAGMRMVHACNGNAWNAFLALKNLELKGKFFFFSPPYFPRLRVHSIEAGIDAVNSVAMHETFINEYNALTDEDKDELVEEYRLIKDRNKTFRRTNAKGRVEDITNTVRNIKRLVSSRAIVPSLPH